MPIGAIGFGIRRLLANPVRYYNLRAVNDIGLSARQPSRGGVLTVTKVTQALGLVHFYTDAAGGYDRPLPATHTIGKAYTHQSERHHLTLRTRIQRLARQTSGFSQSGFMPDTVIGLFVNHYEFGTPV